MTWEIAHNIESLLVKDESKTHAGFDFTVDVNGDSSHDLAECVKGMWQIWKRDPHLGSTKSHHEHV